MSNQKHKVASLVTGPDNLRCIYEMEGSGQTYKVQFPYTKKHVSVFPVTNQDVRDSLELVGILFEGKVTLKGIRSISIHMGKDMDTVKGPSERVKLEVLGIINNNLITPLGLKLLSSKMMEELASVSGGNLAINECAKEESLLKVVL